MNMITWSLRLAVSVLLAFSGVARDSPNHSDGIDERIVRSESARLLVIEAEDLGMAHSIDAASFEALEKGWVTSSDILASAPWFPEVVRWSMTHPDVSLGLQLDLNSEWINYRWRPVARGSKTSSLPDSAGYLPNSARYISQHAKAEDIAAEFRAQIDAAKEAGIPISHLNSHGGIALYSPWLFQEYWKAGIESGLPVLVSREYLLQRGQQTSRKDVYNLSGFEISLSEVRVDRIVVIAPGVSQKDWLSTYENALDSLPPGVYVLSVHLGHNDEELQAMTWGHPNWGAQWRQNDYDVISSPEFHRFLKNKGFILVTWKDLNQAIPRR